MLIMSPGVEYSIRGVLCRAKPIGLFLCESKGTSTWMQRSSHSLSPWPSSSLSSLLLSSSTVVILADTKHKGLNAGCIFQQQDSLLCLLQLWSSTARLFACKAGCCVSETATVYHISGISAWLPSSSSAHCIPSSSSSGSSFRERISTGLQPRGGILYLAGSW